MRINTSIHSFLLDVINHPWPNCFYRCCLAKVYFYITTEVKGNGWVIISLVSCGCNYVYMSWTQLQWCHNGHDGASNHQPHHCLFNRLFRRRSKKTSKVRFTGLCAGNSPVTGEFPAQMASNAENVSIWWRHHANAGLANLSHTVIQISENRDGMEENLWTYYINQYSQFYEYNIWKCPTKIKAEIHDQVCNR